MDLRIPSPLLLLALGLSLWACDPTPPDPGDDSVSDFNPLPDSAEYVFSKSIKFSNLFFLGWACSSQVHRKPSWETDSERERRFIDNNSVSCTFIGSSPDGKLRDTTRFTATYMDTITFLEGEDSLTLEGADRFLNIALPPGLHPGYPEGLKGGSSFGTSSKVTFPKWDFPDYPGRNQISPDLSADCWYDEAGQRTPCKRLSKSNLRYRSEILTFLRGLGFLSLGLNSSGTLGMSDQGSSMVRLLYRVKGGDTLHFSGNIQNP